MPFERRIQPALFNRLQMHAIQIAQLLLCGTSQSIQQLIQRETIHYSYKAKRYSGYFDRLQRSDIDVIETLAAEHLASYQEYLDERTNEAATGIPPPVQSQLGATHAAP